MGQSKSIGNIKACVDASLAVMQELAYATARKGKKFGATCGITCFGCKKPGHLRKDCKNFSGDKKRIPLSPWLSCGKGKHRRSECKSKSHKDGTQLTREAGKTKNYRTACFGCEKPGHLSKDCKNPWGKQEGPFSRSLSRLWWREPWRNEWLQIKVP